MNQSGLISRQSGNPLATFRSSFGSLYMELVDLLLKRSETAADTADQQRLLSEARDRVEQFKVAELKDYFQDECVVAYRPHTTQLDIVSQSAGVIYPILLPDRIDMRISLPGRLKRMPTIGGSSNAGRRSTPIPYNAGKTHNQGIHAPCPEVIPVADSTH